MLATLGLVFDGYDLVVYGVVVPAFLRDDSHIGPVTPAMAELLRSYAPIGVMAASRAADRFGPKPVVAACFAIGAMALALLTLGLPAGLLLLIVAARC